jgi:uncharacterized protein
MLLSFRFANHRSFRDEQQLNLLPLYGDDGDQGDEDPLEAVSVAGIFGANASGKSNVISALNYMSRMVGESDRESEPGLGPRRQPFRLDPQIEAQPSSYAVDLMLDGIRHTYGFTLDSKQVLEEWLYSYPLRRKRVIFERTRQHFGWGEEARRSSAVKLADIVAPTALFLSVAARFDPRDSPSGDRDSTTESLHGTFSWLWQKVSRDWPITRATTRVTNYTEWLSDPARHAAIAEILRNADVGLLDVFADPPESGEQLSLSRRLVYFRHQGANDDVLFNTSEESSGTLRLLELTARAIPVLNAGGLFLVDEIDASLHPLLTATLIHLFQSPDVNKRGGQLVFTSHDATLLGSIDGEDVLHRDQVWFTSKGPDGASELFPLAEFKPRRQGENRQKRYLNGSYGAIPELSMRLFELAVTSRVDSDAE